LHTLLILGVLRMLSWLEQLAISVLLGVLHQVVKNPVKAAVVKVHLLGLADDIYVSYGLVPPAHD
jgi:hypothetical protein